MYITKQIQNNVFKKKNHIHQRSILREMINTLDKLGNSFLTKTQVKQYQNREKQQWMDTMQFTKVNSIQKIDPSDTSKKDRYSHDPFKGRWHPTQDGQVYVKQSKEIKQIKLLKQKLLPKVSQTNIERKLKQLTYIKNMGYTSKNGRVEQFKQLSPSKDQQNIINKSWQNFYLDKLDFIPAKQPQDQRKKTFAVPKSKFGMTTDFKQRKTIKLKTKFPSSSQQTTPSDFGTAQHSRNISIHAQNEIESVKSSENTIISRKASFNNTDSNFLDHTVQFINPKKFYREAELQNFDDPLSRSRYQRVSNRNKTKFKRSLMNVTHGSGAYQEQKKGKKKKLKLSSRRGEITDKIGLNKEKLQNQNAYQLYTLVKGGYSLDRSDIQGQHISLARFREAKQNFMILNNCFKKVREYRYISQQPQNIYNDQSFKSLVYMCEIENKVPPSLFNKLKKSNKVVS